VATIIQDKHCGNHNRNQRWTRLERADLFARYGELHTQGVSQRQAAKVLEAPRSTLQRVFPAHYGEKRTISEGYWNFYSLCSHYKISL